jgi:hypothetical protein
MLADCYVPTGLQSDLRSHSIEPIYAVDYTPSRLLTSLHRPITPPPPDCLDLDILQGHSHAVRTPNVRDSDRAT